MHLSDGILTNPALVTGLNLVGAGALGVALREVAEDRDRQIVLTGTLAAFVLVAQSINVPLVPGASAHLIGATLLTLVAGAARAVVALSAVLVVQALLLADGGVVVLGMNMLHIAVLPVLAVHFLARTLGRDARALGRTAVAGTILGSALGAASLATALVVGADVRPSLAFGWLVGVQALAGLVEGLLTAAVLRQLSVVAPDLLAAGTSSRASVHRLTPMRAAAWATVAIGIGIALSPLASATPDALDRVVEPLEARR